MLKLLKPLLFAALLLCGVNAHAFITGRDCTGPTLTPAGTRIVNVANITQLNNAVGNIQAGDTIVLANGSYVLTASLFIHAANVTIMGIGPGCGGATLQGAGENNLAGPEFGIWTDAVNLTVAQLTIRETWDNTFICNAGCQAPHLYNVTLIDAGAQFVKINGAHDNQVSGAIIEYSHFEYTGSAPTDRGTGAGYGYFNGISAHGSNNLIVRDNTFINLHASDTCFTQPNSIGDPNCFNPSVLVWNGSTNPTVERNLFINVDQGISFGLVQRSGFLDNSGGIARNNVIYNAPGFWSSSRTQAATNDALVRTFESPNSKMYNNTIISDGTYGKCLVNRFATSTGVLYRNNACDVGINSTDLGATATVTNNVTNATSAAFKNMTNADFHLLIGAGSFIGAGFAATADVLQDFDLQTRTVPYDIGAYKYVATTTGQPLLTQANVTYLGRFAIDRAGTYGASWFGYAGRGLAFYQDPVNGKTLYMQGNASTDSGTYAQIKIPATLSTSTTWATVDACCEAQVLQNFVRIADGGGPDPSSCTGNPAHIYGSMVYNSRLIVGDVCYYGGSQTTSVGVHSPTLATGGQINTWYGSTAAVGARALGGYMWTVPADWQVAFGGPVMTGNCCLSVISSSSAGPAATVFDPNTVGVTNPFPGTTVLNYQYPNELCGNGPQTNCDSTTGSLYNLTTIIGGAFWPAGTRSVMFVMGQGYGCYWYGAPDIPESPCTSQDTDRTDVTHGPHAPPYRFQILAYDANDLLAVKNGTMLSYNVRPYATIVLSGGDMVPGDTNANIKGATYDNATGRLYVTGDYGDHPIVEVFQITAPVTGNKLPQFSNPYRIHRNF